MLSPFCNWSPSGTVLFVVLNSCYFISMASLVKTHATVRSATPVFLLLLSMLQYHCGMPQEKNHVTDENCAAYLNTTEQVYRLFEAATYSNMSVASCLVNSGVNPSASVAGGFTPIQAAAVHGDIDMCRFLINAGANVNTHDSLTGLSPLLAAAGKNYLDIATLLLDSGANVNTKNKFNKTPLHIAAQKGHLEICQLLLERGAEVNIRDRDLNTALHIAVLRSHLPVVQLLLQQGGDLSAKNIFGQTPRAAASRNQDIANWLDSQK
ncbi:ankyrin repeat domain-containing protein 65-like isoform X2 [Zootermopsis nevadensis]|uniref:ankyrin repeat domain-containing protein 65-like isoform X2 n=1 Tax=Zootermopsis nevadensis TaxID=136037 RepID=UPI000B8EA63A|nr:ankyrin repeat domain-containing protein 65-like isoform X2 [Zootermopsis nevadensis]